MANVTVFTAARMKQIEDQAVIGGQVVGDNLILRRFNDETFNAGNVRGLTGDQGVPGEVSLSQLSYASGTELREHFGDMPNGATPMVTQTGQPVVNYEPFGGGNKFTILNGFLTRQNPGTSVYGAYRIAELRQNAVRIGAQFAFTSFTQTGGLLCLSIQETSIATNTAVPRSSMHLRLTPNDWGIDVNDTAGTEVEGVASGTFRTPLVANGTKLHSIEIVMDAELERCYLYLPDGTFVTLKDPRFAIPGRFVYVEPFKASPTNVSAQTEPLIRSWWADSNRDSLVNARAIAGTEWIDVTGFQNGWQNFGDGFQTAQYRKVGDKVELRGVIKGTSMGGIAFTLPTGYRPPAQLFQVAPSYNVLGYFSIGASGSVIMNNGSHVYMSISGMFSTRP